MERVNGVYLYISIWNTLFIVIKQCVLSVSNVGQSSNKRILVLENQGKCSKCTLDMHRIGLELVCGCNDKH